MNWLPRRNIKGKVTSRNKRFSRSVVFRYFKQSRRIGRYKACVKRETGFSDSGLSLPRMNVAIKIGTRVIASNDENATAMVLVHASGRNIRPSWASNRKTGRNETTIMSKEKKIAGP